MNLFTDKEVKHLVVSNEEAEKFKQEASEMTFVCPITNGRVVLFVRRDGHVLLESIQIPTLP